MKFLGAPFEIKTLEEKGTFDGVASLYGNVDLGGDVVEPGAFKEFVFTKDNYIRILDGHNTRAPIGKGKVMDSHLGLVIEGKLNLAIGRAREVYELMKDNIIDGLSIGYDVLPGGAEIMESGVRRLKALKLWEVSTTPFPMNQLALVNTVKSIERANNVRDVEDMLRDAVGLSRAQAKLHAGAIWKTLTGQREVDETVVKDEVKAMADRIRSFAPAAV